MKIADLVKNKRLELKESQGEFGKRFALSHAAISDLERGVTLSITEHMLNFLFKEGCEHPNRTFRKTVIVKCLDCGLEQEENMKFPKVSGLAEEMRGKTGWLGTDQESHDY